jgi:HAD superfamily hydrolase (TIGR01490 family)
MNRKQHDPAQEQVFSIKPGRSRRKPLFRCAAVPRRATYPDRVDNPADHGRTAAFFDLDKTVIAKSSTLAFSKPFYAGGLISRRAALRSAYAHFVFLAAGADHDQVERMRAYLSTLCAGWDVQQVHQIVAEALTGLIEPMVYREATALIAEHRQRGRDVVLVSASGAEVVEPIGAMLGVDHVVATRMVVEDGHYTGDIEFYAYGENKAVAIRDLAAERGYDLAGCYAYSDSGTDLPMLQAVGHPSAVNPDRALRKAATANGWPVLNFSQPVTLRSRMAGQVARVPQPTPAVAAAVAVGAGAATAGLVWYANRKRSTAPL